MARVILVACIICLYSTLDSKKSNPYIFKNILFSLFLNHTTPFIDPTVETLESDFQHTVIQS
mgnify:CR=1 FL=1